MAGAESGMKKMIGFALALVSLAVITMMGIAVIGGFKDTGLVDNSTADNFISGLAIFGTFIGILALAVIGKVVMALFRTED